MAYLWIASAVVGVSALLWNLKRITRSHGTRLKRNSKTRRKFILRSSASTDSQTQIVGFFHPYCNAGGGGERVLWAAIRTTLQDIPNAFCIIYSGDVGVTKSTILARAQDAFGIELDMTRLDIVTLKKRHLVSAEAWPHFTLIGQSLGSIVLAYEALSSFVPDIYIDTMGYAFTYPLVHYLLNIPVVSYTHYPTITSDMFSKVSGTNVFKLIYWRIFALLYSVVGQYADYVMANSTWTMNHLRETWKIKAEKTKIVYPPCDTRALSAEVSVQTTRRKEIVCVAQFRPEKDHATLLKAFAMLIYEVEPVFAGQVRMTLIGTVRDEDDRTRVYKLKELTKELKISEWVEFCEDVPWTKVKAVLARSWIGTNAMWNEHFGIGVVEYMAAGLIPVVHDSAGPKLDIVTPFQGLPTGYHASDVRTFAQAFCRALSLEDSDCIAMRQRAQKSSTRFSEEVFADAWGSMINHVVKLAKRKRVA